MYKKPEYSPLSDEIFDKPNLIGDMSRLDLHRRRRSNGDHIEKFDDYVNEYNLNSLGFRSKEFTLTKLVTAGCSYTFGVGLPESGIWSSIFAEKVGLEHSNVAIPGWSVEAIVEGLFNYFYTYGNPEVVAVLLPEYGRAVLPSRRGLCTIWNKSHDENCEVLFEDALLSKTPVEKRSKYSKKPHDLIEVLSPEFGLLQTFKALNSLIIYCRTANIKLIWGTWLQELDMIFSNAKELFNDESYNGYVSLLRAMDSNLSDPELECHQSDAETYGKSFYQGLDRDRHPGVHLHLHYAEMFYEKYLEMCSD